MLFLSKKRVIQLGENNNKDGDPGSIRFLGRFEEKDAKDVVPQNLLFIYANGTYVFVNDYEVRLRFWRTDLLATNVIKRHLVEVILPRTYLAGLLNLLDTASRDSNIQRQKKK